MKCSKAGKKNGGRMLNENHKGWDGAGGGRGGAGEALADRCEERM